MTLRRSALYETHEKLGAKCTDFGGWEMPLTYPLGTIGEHLACRRAASIFDVSHLGTVEVTGPKAKELLQAGLTNNLDKIAPKRAQYTHLVDEEYGGVIDDIIVWWVDEETFHVMPNASNTRNVLDVLGGHDITETRAVIALQGPTALGIAAQIADCVSQMKRFRVERFRYLGAPAIVSTTGYTGELGVEFSVPNEVATQLFDELISLGATPSGLGARDTLRLEAGLPLHGHELGPQITPYEANLGWVVDLNKANFRGKAALERARNDPRRRHLLGLLGDSRQPFRAESEVGSNDANVGVVTSGNYSPMLGVGIAMALCSQPLAPKSPVTVSQRGRERSASVCEMPFFAKKYS